MATSTSQNNFDIPKGGYVAFDAMSLRQLIIDRLNEQQVFTDQNFLGSNLASVIDIISFSYNALIYYLNKTSSESMFSEASLYENMNRIVRLIDYSPIGFQTSTLTFNCSASNLTQGLYTIPRYSYVLTNNIPFSFNEDITFAKSSNNIVESLNELAQQKLLFQGLYQEHPLYTASGEDNEMIIVNAGDSIVDHFNIDVYVKSILTGKWEEYTKTANLFLETGSAKKYEIRLNGNKRYEIKFGNDINGAKLQTRDQVAIYYLASLGAEGEVGPGALNDDSRLVTFNSVQFNNITNDVFANQYRLLTNAEAGNLNFTNTNNSTTVKAEETVEQIRQTAPANYRSQYRLVTTRDYEVFAKTNFANLLADVKCVNNWDYVAGYLKYFYDIGITDPARTERALFNQVQYADSCNFNNVYLLVVPRSVTSNLDYLVPAQKELINSSLANSKMTTTETVFIDPVYKAVSFGISSSLSTVDPIIDESKCYLEIIKRTSSRRDNQSIINDVVNVISTYFNRKTLKLGQTIDVRSLTQQILDIDGVDTFYTRRTDDPTLKAQGLSLFFWNPIYPTNDKTVTTNNIPLKYFEYPFFNNLSTIASKITVTAVTTVFETIEY
jgi:hypothetical protein